MADDEDPTPPEVPAAPGDPTPQRRAEDKEGRRGNGHVDQLRTQVAKLQRLAEARDPAAIEALVATSQTLADAVANMTTALQDTKRLGDKQAELQARQTLLEEGVVPKERFDLLWAENTATLQRSNRRSARLSLLSFVASLLVIGSAVGWFVNYQLGKNGDAATSTEHQTALNAQRLAACNTKNAALQQGVDSFGSFIDQEKALRHPDPVIVEVLTLVRLSTKAQIVPCPGAKPTPSASPSASDPPGSFLLPPPSDSPSG